MIFSIQLYREAGLPLKSTFNLNIAQYSIGITGNDTEPQPTYFANLSVLIVLLGSVGSWFLMARVGRRTLYLYGLFAMSVLLLAIGGCGVARKSEATSWAAGSLILVYTFFYNITVGSLGYSIVSEIPSTRLKNNTVALARCAYNAVRDSFLELCNGGRC